jgi:hypothetical protein
VNLVAQPRRQAGKNEEVQVGQTEPELKPEINQSPDDLWAMNEKQQHFIITERQKILRALCEKIAVYTDGRIILAGLIEVK